MDHDCSQDVKKPCLSKVRITQFVLDIKKKNLDYTFFPNSQTTPEN